MRKNTFAETCAVAEKILADLKAQGLKVSDEYEISAEEELERLQLEELKILTETYSEDRFNADVPFTFRALVESIFIPNSKRGREAAEKILAAFDPPEKILQASQERLYELTFYGNLRARGKILFRILKILAERDKLPETFAEFLMLPNLDDNLAAKIKYGLIVNSDADFNKHVLRVANRMKIAEAERPVRVPINLQPKLFRHGKEICTEHEPKCKICPLSKICPSKI